LLLLASLRRHLVIATSPRFLTTLFRSSFVTGSPAIAVVDLITRHPYIAAGWRFLTALFPSSFFTGSLAIAVVVFIIAVWHYIEASWRFITAFVNTAG